MRRHAIASSALAIAAVALSSCGGSSSGAATGAGAAATAAATPAGFRAQASSICDSVLAQDKQLKAREESLKGQPQATAQNAFIVIAKQAAQVSTTAEGKLAELPRPSADAAQIAQLLHAYTLEAAFARDIASAADNQENNQGEEAEISLSRSIAANSARAAALGMGGCINAE